MDVKRPESATEPWRASSACDVEKPGKRSAELSEHALELAGADR
jgi:hypothetical protein